MNFENKNVIITGANGLVGIPTIKKCLNENVAHIYAVDINIGKELKFLSKKYSGLITLIQEDLTDIKNCENLFKDKKINYVLHLAGIKGNPIRAKNNPADYFFPMLMFNTNMIKAAFDANVDWFVYMSSVGVYHPADIMHEDSVWKTFPSQNDWFPGWAKRCGELALEALNKQYGWNNYTIIRPANIFGENDNFSPDATVIASNIWKIFNTNSDEIECWGDGTPKRDFVFARDVANATIEVVKKEVRDIINFGSGTAISIKDTIETIVNVYKKIFKKDKKIVWNTEKPNGDMHRCLSSDKQLKYDILPITPFEKAIEYTILGYKRKTRNFDLILKNGYHIGHISEIINDWDEFKDIIKNVSKFDKNKDYYNYRYHIKANNGPVPDWEVSLDQIEERKKWAIENNKEIAQSWYVSKRYLDNNNFYFHNIISNFITDIYPELENNNIQYFDQFTIYENDDFIEPHADGYNPGRLCVILIYFSELPEIDHGGQLIIENKSNQHIYVEPEIGTYVILDFTENNLTHAVEKIKNNFQRKSFLTFIYNTHKKAN